MECTVTLRNVGGAEGIASAFAERTPQGWRLFPGCTLWEGPRVSRGLGRAEQRGNSNWTLGGSGNFMCPGTSIKMC